MCFPVDKDEQDNADQQAANDCQWNQPCRQHDADRNRPEEKGDIQRLLDGGTEADDGQGAYHTKGKYHIGSHSKNDKGCDHGEGDQRHAETGRVHNAGKGLFIDKKDEHADAESQQQRQRHVENTDTGDIIEET